MNNYLKIESKYIKDIDSEVTIYRHIKSGARICTMKNTDPNKVFAIAFRTPAKDSTGLTHILEHSVLCGSDKYPVKDPFVELLKGSLNTFLNAFTYPDKTCYPVASLNLADFKNLMSVYLDSVFNPNIYKHKEIFLQEGWHYQITDKNDPLTINGVVYNEMKGSFSSKDTILFNAVQSSLLRNTSYNFISGGDPKHIPELSYEDFLDFHKKYYSPSNSYIYVYGDIDMEERLEYLDQEYLSKYDIVDFDTKIKTQRSFTKTVEVTEYYPISNEEDEEEKATIVYSYLLPKNIDRIALGILDTVMIDSPASLFTKRLLERNLCKSVSGGFESEINQPCFLIICEGSDVSKKDEIKRTIDEVFEEYINGGLDHSYIESTICFEEFKQREKNAGYIPVGLLYIMSSLSSWLYDDSKPYAHLENLKHFKKLKKVLDTDYFEKVLTKCFVDNKSRSLVCLVPSKTLKSKNDIKLKKQLADYKKSLSDKQLDELIEMNKNLVKYQEAEPTKEEIDTLPKLTIDDIKEGEDLLECKKDKIDDIVTYKAFDNSKGIGYCKYFFDVSDIDKKDLPYLKILSSLLFELRTDKKDETELDKEENIISGEMKAKINKSFNNNIKLFFEVGYSALYENIGKCNNLVKEVLFESKLDNNSKVKEKVDELCIAFEDKIISRGDVYASLRASSYVDENYYNNELISGISFLDFVKDLSKNYASREKELMATLKRLIATYFVSSRLFVSYGGEKKGYREFVSSVKDFVSCLPQGEKVKVTKSSFVPKLVNEAIETEGDVCYVVRAMNNLVDKINYKDIGAYSVLNVLIDFDYLWANVRVKGGAYGCSLAMTKFGQIRLSSFRDPNLAATDKVYMNTPKFISNIKCNKEELLKFKIGAISRIQGPFNAVGRLSQALEYKLAGYTNEMIKQNRNEIILTTEQDLVDSAKMMEKALEISNLCVVGNSKIIEENKDKFDVIRKLVK